VAKAAVGARFGVELKDFLRFVRAPGLNPRLPGREAANGWWQDWFPTLSLGRLLQWAFLLWAINLVFLGPIAVAAAGAGGAVHRLDIHNIPWLQALLWAPVVEELVFRHGLRKPGMVWWLAPLTAVALVSGPQWWAVALVGLVLLFGWYLGSVSRTPVRRRWRRIYVGNFPWVLHFSCLLFAAMHLYNFSLNQMPYWLMPLLVLPQWVTGLVLAWLRVRRGIGAAILLHGIFNGGPLLVVWLVLNTVGDLPGAL